MMDPIEEVLELVTFTVDEHDEFPPFITGTLARDGGWEWQVLAYFRPLYSYEGPPEDGDYEIDVKAATLREVLGKVIAHPRFGQ